MAISSLKATKSNLNIIRENCRGKRFDYWWRI